MIHCANVRCVKILKDICDDIKNKIRLNSLYTGRQNDAPQVIFEHVS